MNRLAGSASLAYYSVSFSGRRLSSLLGAEKSGNFMSLPRCIVRTLRKRLARSDRDIWKRLAA